MLCYMLVRSTFPLPTAAGLRLTPSKGKGAATAAAGGGRRLFADGSGSDSGSEYGGGSDDDADDSYRPDPHHLSGRGKGSVLSKRKRHGQLPGTASDKVGLCATCMSAYTCLCLLVPSNCHTCVAMVQHSMLLELRWAGCVCVAPGTSRPTGCVVLSWAVCIPCAVCCSLLGWVLQTLSTGVVS
jgi:hypothetical protein